MKMQRVRHGRHRQRRGVEFVDRLAQTRRRAFQHRAQPRRVFRGDAEFAVCHLAGRDGPLCGLAGEHRLAAVSDALSRVIVQLVFGDAEQAVEFYLGDTASVDHALFVVGRGEHVGLALDHVADLLREQRGTGLAVVDIPMPARPHQAIAARHAGGLHHEQPIGKIGDQPTRIVSVGMIERRADCEGFIGRPFPQGGGGEAEAEKPNPRRH
ncbi:hypothetical protein ONR75_11110 [Rhodopseudomonas sp. P2A-2r]|nr:hypothetical protein [Rhodopseudomonas sp. P2A-2r]UZE52425.1 hypothetical protein ONR75_11110 [Rhodopseudomonas sp. P2A-2r]